MRRTIKRFLCRVKWRNLRSVQPISKVFGLDRGLPIDRYYIEQFLDQNKHLIQGVVCEIAESTYSQRFGTKVSRYEVLHAEEGNRKATIVGDLTQLGSLPENCIDCFVLTQTLGFIYDFQEAIRGVHQMLKKGGVVLATVGGISQISRYDMDRWGDYWRFTDLSLQKSFEEIFGKGSVEVSTYGNVLTAVSFLEGISAEELTKEELRFRDSDYQVTITVKATK